MLQLPDPIGLVAKDRIQRFSDEPSAADIVVFCPVAVRILPGKLIDPVSVQCEYESALPDQLLLLNIGGVQGYLHAVIMDLANIRENSSDRKSTRLNSSH